MRNKRLQSQVTAGRWTLPAVIFICALCWVLTYFLFPGSIASTVLEDSPSAWQNHYHNSTQPYPEDRLR